MKRLLIVALVAGALVQAGAASAGCMATVGLQPPPDGLAPGKTWTAKMTILQHGQTPLPDAKTARPTLTIRNESGASRTFVARPTKDLTVFQAAVVFPSAGSWRYEVFDGFTTYQGQPEPCARTHTFSAVTIGAPAGGGGAGGAEPPAQAPAPVAPVSAAAETSGDGFPVWPVVGSVLAALAAVGFAAGVVRRRKAHRAAEVAVR